jgi:hypothetical protein
MGKRPTMVIPREIDDEGDRSLSGRQLPERTPKPSWLPGVRGC